MNSRERDCSLPHSVLEGQQEGCGAASKHAAGDSSGAASCVGSTGRSDLKSNSLWRASKCAKNQSFDQQRWRLLRELLVLPSSSLCGLWCHLDAQLRWDEVTSGGVQTGILFQ